MTQDDAKKAKKENRKLVKMRSWHPQRTPAELNRRTIVDGFARCGVMHQKETRCVGS